MRILTRIGIPALLICLLTVAAGRAFYYFQAASENCTQAGDLQPKDLQKEALYTVGEIRTTSSGGKELTLLSAKYKLALYLPELPIGVEWGGQYLLSIKKYNSISQIRQQSPDMEGFVNYLNSKGICGTVQQVSWSGKVGQTDPIGKFFYQLRAKLATPLQQALPPETSALLQALILGEKNSLDSQAKDLTN